MTRSGEQRGAVGLRNNHTKKHDGDAMRQIPNGGNVVRDKEKGKPKPFLERLEKKDDSRAQRDVQSRGRLVRADGPRGDGARNVEALPLPIGKLVRIALYKVGSEAHFGDDRVQSLAPLGGRHLEMQP